MYSSYIIFGFFFLLFFLPNFSTIIHSLNHLFKKFVRFRWSAECQRVFNAIKNKITSDGIITHVKPKLFLVLATDASHYVISVVFSHIFPNISEN